MRMKDLTGQRFGRLVVLRFLYKKKNNYYWLCKCDCGKERIVSRSHLFTKHTTSCGCMQREKARKAHIVHNMAQSRIYRIWCGIKDRCLNLKKNNYKYYGGRGIKICEEWKKDFMNFHNWAMANGYREDLTIERIDNNGNYEPSNCKWATKQEQANNTRRNRNINYKGKIQSLANWCRELKINYQTAKIKIKTCPINKLFEKRMDK